MTPDRQFSDPRLADLYDLGNAGSEDRDFYLSLVGETSLDILDLGCGTGLLALEYAARGHRVVGVDPAAAMLEVALRADTKKHVVWIQDFAETFTHDRRFDLIIMTGHAFQVLLGDDQVEGSLSNMIQHLKPNGTVVFESRNPSLNWDSQWAREYEMQTDHGSVRASRRMTDTSAAPEFLSFAWDYQFSDMILTSESTLRFLSVEKILGFARRAGLRLEVLYGDWDRSPFNPEESREMIFKFRRIDAQ